ncbi:glycosyltransferase family 4 protein [Lutibacter sp.]
MKNIYHKQKLWIVTEYYYPTVISSGYYMTEIAEYLATRLDNVNIICTSSSYNKKGIQKPKKYEVVKNVSIYRVISGNINKNNFVLRVFGLFWSSLLLFNKVLFKVHKGDTLFVVTNPAFFILLLPIIKKIKKLEYTVLVHDIFPENLSAIGKIKNTSLVYKILKKLFDTAYSQSANCIAIGRDMKVVIRKKIANSSNIVLIPNWSDVEEVLPKIKEKTKIIKEFNIENKFVFQFAGNLGHSQGLDNILDAISLVDDPNLHFLFIGSGAKVNTVKEFAKRAPLKNVTYVGFRDRSEQNDFLNACDVAIVTLSDGMFGLGVPSKSYNIMAAGKPIIIVADEDSEISLVVKENNIGWVVKPANSNELKNTFIKIYKNKSNIPEMGKRARKVAEKVYAKKIILENYYDLLNDNL